MIRYFIAKKQKFIEVEKIENNKELAYVGQGIIDFENLKRSNLEEDIFKIPQENQKELNEKGETVFMILTKTLVHLKKE